MERFDVNDAQQNEVINSIRSEINFVYNQQETIKPKQILEIKENLEKIPNLVINFDETMTADDTIRKVIRLLVAALPDQAQILNQKITKFRQMAEKYRVAKEKGEKYPVNLIKYFYTDVINGINIEVLKKIYDQVIIETEINPNLEKIFEYIKQGEEINKISLFVLSLNINQIVEKFYQKNIDFFKKHNVEIVGIMCNQIKTDTNNNIIDVYEHVTDQNKKEYVPPQSIMLADDRETKELAESGINVVNIQGEKFRHDILDISLRARNLHLAIDAIEYPTETEQTLLKNIKSQSGGKLQEIKIRHEKNQDINILISQYLIFYEESSKLTAEFIKTRT